MCMHAHVWCLKIDYLNYITRKCEMIKLTWCCTYNVLLTEMPLWLVQICKFARNFSCLSGNVWAHPPLIVFIHLFICPLEQFLTPKALPLWTRSLQRWCVVGRDNICNYWTPHKALNKMEWKKSRVINVCFILLSSLLLNSLALLELN